MTINKYTDIISNIIHEEVNGGCIWDPCKWPEIPSSSIARVCVIWRHVPSQSSWMLRKWDFYHFIQLHLRWDQVNLAQTSRLNFDTGLSVLNVKQNWLLRQGGSHHSTMSISMPTKSSLHARHAEYNELRNQTKQILWLAHENIMTIKS